MNANPGVSALSSGFLFIYLFFGNSSVLFLSLNSFLFTSLDVQGGLAHSQLCVGESLSDVHVPRSHVFVEYVSVQRKGSPCLAFIYVMTSAGVTSEDRSRSQMLKQRWGVAASFMAPGICVCVCPQG